MYQNTRYEICTNYETLGYAQFPLMYWALMLHFELHFQAEFLRY